MVLFLATVESLGPLRDRPVDTCQVRVDTMASANDVDCTSPIVCAEKSTHRKSNDTHKQANDGGGAASPRSDEGPTPAGRNRSGACLEDELDSPRAFVASHAQRGCSSAFCLDDLLASPPLAIASPASPPLAIECHGCDEGGEVDGADEVAEAMQVLRRNNVSLPQIATALMRPPGEDSGIDRAGDGGRARKDARKNGGARGDRPSDEQQYQQSTSQCVLAKARAGIVDSSGVHVASKCPLGRSRAAGVEPRACHIDAFRAMCCGDAFETRPESEVGLEPWEFAFNQTRRVFMAMPSSSRGRHLFALLSGWYTWDRAAMKQHYFVAGHEVCRCIFLLVYPVEKTVERVTAAIKSGSVAYYVRDLEGPQHPRLAQARGASTFEAAAWLLAWAETEGERIPGPEFAGKLYVPRVDVSDLMREVNELRGECGHVTPFKYGVVHKAWTKHPTLAHVRIHRDKRNFQQCSICVNLRALLRGARQKGDEQRGRELQAELRTHRLLQRTERERYYFRRAMACQPNSQSLSLIFDKWSSWTTIVPWFARSPGGAWRDAKDDVLQLHVMLVRIHGKPNCNYFFAANDSIKCGGNFTIETVPLRPPLQPAKPLTPYRLQAHPTLAAVHRSGVHSSRTWRERHCLRR